MDTIWKSIILIFAGVIFLRLSGRKSISQMTMSQTVIMIAIGALIAEPLVKKTIWQALLAAAVFVAANLLMELLQIKFNFFENLLTGKARPVIKEGRLLVENLRSIRVTVDQLEM